MGRLNSQAIVELQLSLSDLTEQDVAEAVKLLTVARDSYHGHPLAFIIAVRELLDQQVIGRPMCERLLYSQLSAAPNTGGNFG
jgi:hypothetical protein